MYPTENNTRCGAAEFEEENDGKPRLHVIMMPDTPSQSILKPKSNGFWTKKRIVCVVMAILVCIGCGAGAVWYFYSREKESTPTSSSHAKKKGRIIVMRHGTRDDDAQFEDKSQRPYDIPIKKDGTPQEALKELKEFDIQRIISSPYRRCLQTATIIANELGIPKIKIDSRIGETGRAVFGYLKDKQPGFQTMNDFKYLSVDQMKSEHGGIEIEWIDETHKPSYDPEHEKESVTENNAQYHDFRMTEFSKLFKEEKGDTLIVSHAVPCNIWSNMVYDDGIDYCGWIAFEQQKDGKIKEIAHSKRCEKQGKDIKVALLKQDIESGKQALKRYKDNAKWQLILGGAVSKETKAESGFINMNKDPLLRNKDAGIIICDFLDAATMEVMQQKFVASFDVIKFENVAFDVIKHCGKAFDKAICINKFFTSVWPMLEDKGTFQCPCGKSEDELKGYLKRGGFNCVSDSSQGHDVFICAKKVEGGK